MICFLEFTEIIMKTTLVYRKMTQRIWYLTEILINDGLTSLSKLIFHLFFFFLAYMSILSSNI